VHECKSPCQAPSTKAAAAAAAGAAAAAAAAFTACLGNQSIAAAADQGLTLFYFPAQV